MLQSHSLILWANASNEEFQVSLNKAHDLLLALKDFGPELSPNYLPANRKKDVTNFDWSLETLQELFKKGINKEGEIAFPDLGYELSFFSSLDEDESAGISMTLGVRNNKFINNFVVDLPLSLPIYESLEVNKRLITVFKECVRIFNPFWACIGNDVNLRRYDGYWGNKLPTAIHWVNYFGSEVSKTFGDVKITSSPTYIKEKFHSGYLLLLKNGPINDEIEDDVKLQHRANKHFSL
jgi:hypothetical protein